MCRASTADLVIEHKRNIILIEEVGKRCKVFMTSARAPVERYKGGGLVKIANDFIPLEHEDLALNKGDCGRAKPEMT